MYNTLKRLYKEKRLTDKMLTKAVKKHWITDEEAERIKQEVTNEWKLEKENTLL